MVIEHDLGGVSDERRAWLHAYFSNTGTHNQRFYIMGTGRARDGNLAEWIGAASVGRHGLVEIDYQAPHYGKVVRLWSADDPAELIDLMVDDPEDEVARRVLDLDALIRLGGCLDGVRAARRLFGRRIPLTRVNIGRALAANLPIGWLVGQGDDDALDERVRAQARATVVVGILEQIKSQLGGLIDQRALGDLIALVNDHEARFDNDDAIQSRIDELIGAMTISESAGRRSFRVTYRRARLALELVATAYDDDYTETGEIVKLCIEALAALLGAEEAASFHGGRMGYAGVFAESLVALADLLTIGEEVAA